MLERYVIELCFLNRHRGRLDGESQFLLIFIDRYLIPRHVIKQSDQDNAREISIYKSFYVWSGASRVK